MDLAAIVQTYWPVILGFVATIVWSIRQEGQILMLKDRQTIAEGRLAHHDSQIDLLESGLSKELNEVKQSLARIEGYLKAKAENQEH